MEETFWFVNLRSRGEHACNYMSFHCLLSLYAVCGGGGGVGGRGDPIVDMLYH